MIIISKHSNQLCNRLFTYLPILSYALEAKESVCFWFQYKTYYNYFPNLSQKGIASYFADSSVKPSLSSKIVNGIIRLTDKCIHLILKANEPIPLHKPLGVLFNDKWKNIRYDKAYINKHSDSLRQLFAPAPDIWQSIDNMLSTSAEKVITVGVHMRGGDYRTYLGGRYFYEPETYKSVMLQMQNLLANKVSVRFLLCTNEKVAPDAFEGLNVVQQQGNNVLIDLYGLSRCDYIIGPPSTFSQWASFYGKVPLMILYNANDVVSLSKFKRTLSLDVFEE